MPFQKPTVHLLVTDLFWSGMAAQLQLSTCYGSNNKREECPNSLWVGGLSQTLKNPQCSPLEPNSVNHFCSQSSCLSTWKRQRAYRYLLTMEACRSLRNHLDSYCWHQLISIYLCKIVSSELSHLGICIGGNADEKKSCIKEKSPVFGRVMNGIVF